MRPNEQRPRATRKKTFLNPNAGKTTLFNALAGLRAKTPNFPGPTVERKIGKATIGQQEIPLVYPPGLFGLESSAPEEKPAVQIFLFLPKINMSGEIIPPPAMSNVTNRFITSARLPAG